MKSRATMPRKKDKKVFAHTAVVGKKLNVYPGHPRGGIRM